MNFLFTDIVGFIVMADGTLFFEVGILHAPPPVGDAIGRKMACMMMS